jgi:uncharacterized RDD family membrane protein YckC
MNYAGIWRRFGAFIIDSIILSVALNFIFWIFGHKVWVGGGIVSFLFGLIANWLYYALLESSSRQATIGKMALGIKVVDYEGKRISFARATARYFSRFISAIILLIGYLMIAFTKRKQALHDIIAKTLVVKDLSDQKDKKEDSQANLQANPSDSSSSNV